MLNIVMMMNINLSLENISIEENINDWINVHWTYIFLLFFLQKMAHLISSSIESFHLLIYDKNFRS